MKYIILLFLSTILQAEDIKVTAIDPPAPSPAATAFKGKSFYIRFEEDTIGYREYNDAKNKKDRSDSDILITRGTTLSIPLMKWPVINNTLRLVIYYGDGENFGRECYVNITNYELVKIIGVVNLEKIKSLVENKKLNPDQYGNELLNHELAKHSMQLLDKKFPEAFSIVMGIANNKDVSTIYYPSTSIKCLNQDITDVVIGLLTGIIE